MTDEVFSSPSCPGQCNPGHGRASFPSSGTLTDTVVGGSGIFVDAIGDVLTGSAKFAEGQRRSRSPDRSQSCPESSRGGCQPSGRPTRSPKQLLTPPSWGEEVAS
jgi:hypothetical protein